EQHNASPRAAILKMEEPRSAVRGFDPCALMRSIDRRTALIEHDLVFVRSIHRLRPQHDLVSAFHPSGRREDVVPAVPFVELRPLERRMVLAAIEYDTAVV